MKKKKLDKTGIIFLTLFLIMSMGILCFHFYRNYKIRTSVPSELYSKEVKLDLDEIKGKPSILRTDDGHFISYTTGDQIVLYKIDKLGNKIKKILLNGHSKYIDDINIVQGKDSYYLVYITYIDGCKKSVEYNFDRNLIKINETAGNIINNIVKIDESSLAYCYDSKVVYKNFAEDYMVNLNYKGIKMISGTKIQGGCFLLLMNNNWEISGIEIKNKISVKKYYYLINKSTSINFKNMVTASDEKNYYSLIETELKGEAKEVKLLIMSKDKNIISYKGFAVGRNKIFYSLLPVSSGDEAKFIGITDVNMPGGKYKEELAEFSIKQGTGRNIICATRLDKIPYSPSYSVDSLIFLTNEGDNNSSIYITSKSDKFKEANNEVKLEEKKLALIDTAAELLTSAAFIFVLGISWMLFAAVLIGIITFIKWKMENTKIELLLIISYIITSLFKTWIIYDTVYIRFQGFTEGVLSNPVYGCILSLILSFICLLFLIYRQRRDEDGMIFFVFFIPLIIDTLLTQLLFVPFL